MATPSHDALKRDYLAYLSLKTDEVKEQKLSRRYYHGSQWTDAQIKTFNRRHQPVVTYNRIARKINAVIGLLEDQRQDPKAYPRTPQQDQGAEIATAVMRYVLDEQAWKEKSPIAALDASVDGIGGVELLIEKGDQGDPEIGLEVVEPSSFFYDPRCLKADFSDARYMGVSKWADLDAVKEMFPAQAEKLDASASDATDLTTDPDSDQKWWSGDENHRKVRLVDHWYLDGGKWSYAIYTGDLVLTEGESYLTDEKGQSTCKYVMYSANVDQDGDRYGFVRGMKSAQDEINQRRSKGLHILNSRRVIITKGQVDDVEKFRLEIARPDGVAEVNPGFDPPKIDDGAKAQELQGHLAFLSDAKAEIEDYGFNPALIGSTTGVASGKALQIQRQSGIAELGPYLMSYKGWKLRLYRAIWNAVRQHWTAERWIRVTDNPALAQAFGYQRGNGPGAPGFVPLNARAVDQMGQQQVVNSLGALDVDIIVDEGPDETTMAADLFDTMKQVLPAIAPMMSPPVAQAALEILISSSPISPEAKQKFSAAMQESQQPNPAEQAAMRLEMQGKQADNVKKMADAKLSLARAANEGAPDGTNQSAELALEWHKALLSALTQIEVARISAGADADSAILDAKMEALLGLGQMSADQQMQLREHAHQLAMAQQAQAAQAAQPQNAAA